MNTNREYALPLGAKLVRFPFKRGIVPGLGRFHRADEGGRWLGAQWYVYAPRIFKPRRSTPTKD